MHLRRTGVAGQHLLERADLVDGALPGGQADRQRAVRLSGGKVRHDKLVGDQRDPIVADRDLGVDQHHYVIGDFGTVAGVGVREEHHLDAAGKVLQLS